MLQAVLELLAGPEAGSLLRGAHRVQKTPCKGSHTQALPCTLSMQSLWCPAPLITSISLFSLHGESAQDSCHTDPLKSMPDSYGSPDDMLAPDPSCSSPCGIP